MENQKSKIKNQKEKEEIAKYINIPNTLLYDKSQVLYGLNFAKMEIRKKDSCILTEGYMDVILSHQAGYENTVAASGTALTPYQLKIIKRYTSNLLFAFDMDVAGDSATKRGIDLAQKDDFNIKIIVYPEGSDPADIIAEDQKKWATLIARAKEITDFYFENTLKKFDKESPRGKKEISKTLLPLIKKIPNKILQSHWAQKLAAELKVSQEAVVEELRKITLRREEPSGVGEKIAEEEGKKEKSREEMLEEKILSLLFRNPNNLNFFEESSLDLFSPQVKLTISTFKKEKVTCKKDLEKVIKKLSREEKIKDLLETTSFRAEIEKEDEPEKEIKLCLQQLKKLRLKDKLENLSQKIQEAEKNSEKGKVKALIQKFNQLAKSLIDSEENAKEKTQKN